MVKLQSTCVRLSINSLNPQKWPLVMTELFSLDFAGHKFLSSLHQKRMLQCDEVFYHGKSLFENYHTFLNGHQLHLPQQTVTNRTMSTFIVDPTVIRDRLPKRAA